MKEEDLKYSVGDVGHMLMKAGFSAFPVVGGPLAEFFAFVVASPIEKRRDNILIEVVEKLNELEKKYDDFDIKKLAEDEMFITTFTHATTIAMRNHQKTKLKALQNAILNSALVRRPEDDLSLIFLNFIDSFTELHLILLSFFSGDTALTYKNDAISKVTGSQSVNGLHFVLNEFIELCLPDLKGKKDIIDLVINDLQKNNIISVDTSHFPTLDGEYPSFDFYNDGSMSPIVSEIGAQFLIFINEPDLP